MKSFDKSNFWWAYIVGSRVSQTSPQGGSKTNEEEQRMVCEDKLEETHSGVWIFSGP